MLSAQLDGEDDPADRDRVDEHLAGCAGCREWLDRAAAVNRVTRTGPVPDVPDLSDAILAALPPGPPGRVPWRVRATAALYVALAAVGAVQLILGLNQVGGGSAGQHVHAGTGADAIPGHLWHESAAWNVAVGAGFLFIALRRSRPTGLVPMLTAFVGMLLLLSLNDLSAARVDGARLVSHGFVILGYLLVVALSRVSGGSAEPPGHGSEIGERWHLVEDPGEAGAVPGTPRLRLVPRGPATAEHEPPGGERRAA